MCLCESCAWLDEWCWPLEKKAIFFAIWTIVHGIVFFIMDLVFFIFSIAENHAFPDLTFIGAILHLASGILMIITIKRPKSCLYMTSIVLSSFLPFCEYVFVYLSVMQIIFIMIGCRYYSTILK
ncbi:uncharacterized protein LOC117782022 [Drosophila innubila]|uniref:uncharacterized protein LOC117782022 n=1 Tax=Drosophila innubila TaxID=198719 RepID=UPI00148BE417|nr:uncharacterized protein LOC117782022 [Drosophila innubila]